MILRRQICGPGDPLGCHTFSVGAPSGTTRRMLARASSITLLPVLTVMLAVLMVQPAQAHPDLEQAKRLAGELELETALASFEHALASGTLSRSELIELLSERAFVFHALHRKSELVQDFIWLSALDPNHRLDLRAPPDLTAIWTSVRDQGRGVLTVQLEANANQDGLRAHTSVGGTVPEGVRSQVVRRRTGESWEALEGPNVREPQAEGSTVDLYAEAIGLGNVVIASQYSADEPLRVTMIPSSANAAPLAGAPIDEPESWTRRHRGWIIGATALVVTAVVVGTVLAVKSAEDNSDNTNLKPMVSF